MRLDSYDSDAFKYGVISFKEKNNVGLIKKLREKDESVNKLLSVEQIIDFSQVEGLTLEEISSYPSLICDNHIFFVMYDQIPMNQRQSNKIRHIISIDRANHNGDDPIDEVITEYLEKHYHDLGTSGRNRINAFLERYRYGSHKETKDRIQYLINKR